MKSSKMPRIPREGATGDGFSVRIESVFREGVSVIHARHGSSLSFNGERIGRKWSGVSVQVPQEIDAQQVPQIVRDLELAFAELGYGYVISRKTGVDVISEAERQAAMAELHDMGYEIEVLPDQKIRQTRRAGAPHADMETLRKQAPRMMALIQTIHGKRQRFEILAQSKEFESGLE